MAHEPAPYTPTETEMVQLMARQMGLRCQQPAPRRDQENKDGK